MGNTYTPKLNLPKPGLSDTNWKDEEDGVKDAIDEIGDLFALALTLPFQAESDLVFYDGFQPQADIMLTAIGIFAITPPTGAALTIDVLKNSVAQTNPATLAAGSSHQKTTLAGGGIAFTSAERVGLKFTQVGSTEPGIFLTVTLYYRKQPVATI